MMFIPERTSRVTGAPVRATLPAASRAASPAPAGVPLFLQGRPAGRALDADTRGAMESRLGADFGAVRVHTDAGAAASARGVAAHAYTVGNDVVFAEGRYAPGTDGGNRLLAHELAHVVQQRRGGAPPAPNGLTERAAERAAVAAVDGAGPVVVAGASEVGLARSAVTTNAPVPAPPQPASATTDEEIRAAREWLATHSEGDAGYEVMQGHLAYLLQQRTGAASSAEAAGRGTRGSAAGAPAGPVLSDEARLNPWPRPAAAATEQPRGPVDDAEAARQAAFAQELRDNPTARPVLDPETGATVGYQITRSGIESLYDTDGKFVRTLGESGLETPPADPTDAVTLGGPIAAKAVGGLAKWALPKLGTKLATKLGIKIGAPKLAAGPLAAGMKAAARREGLRGLKGFDPLSRDPLQARRQIEREIRMLLDEKLPKVTRQAHAERMDKALKALRADAYDIHSRAPGGDEFLKNAHLAIDQVERELGKVWRGLPLETVDTGVTAVKKWIDNIWRGDDWF